MYNLLTVNVGAITNVVALILLFAFALVGMAKGFVKSFFSIFGTIISLLIAILFAPSVAEFLQKNTSIVTSISSGLEGFATRLLGENAMNLTVQNVGETTLRDAGVAGWLISLILSLKGIEGLPLDTTVGQIICPTFAYYVVLVIAIIILFIILKLITILLGNLVKDMYKFSLVARIDKTLGFIIGVINGIVIINLSMLILSIIPIGVVQEFYVNISASAVLRFISKIDVYGYLLNLISTKDLAVFIKGLYN